MTLTTRRRLLVALVLGAIWYLGFLVGGWQGRQSATNAASPDLSITRGALLDALEPTVEQREALEAVMERTRMDADSIMGDLLGEIRLLTQGAEQEMRAMLTPTQQAALDTLIAAPPLPARTRRRRVPD